MRTILITTVRKQFLRTVTVTRIQAVDETAPILTLLSGGATGGSTADLAVTTDEGNGTLYWYVSTSATPPSAADLKAGTGAAFAASAAVTSAGEKTATATGLASQTVHYPHALHRDAAGNESAIVTGDPFTTADVTSPTLSMPTGTKTGTTTATIGATTNEGGGTIYWLASTNVTETSATIIAADNGDAVTGAGTKTKDITGLAPGTTYQGHAVQVDVNGNVSNVVYSESFVTDAGIVGPDIYVDSVNGLDTNDGLTASSALQTLAAAAVAAKAFGDGVVVGLAAGSSWAGESLKISDPYSAPDPSNGTVLVYGASGVVGDIVTIDCSKPASNASFSANATYPATCYDIAWAHGMAVSAINRITVFEDGKQLVRRSTLALCNSNPGSFFGGNTVTGTPQTMVVHPYGSTNPTTDGKAYRLTYVDSAIIVSHGWTITGPILTMRNGGNDGSMVAGTNATISKVLCYQGTKHNGALGSGSISDSIALDIPFAETLNTGAGSASPWVSYNNQSVAVGVVWTRCGAVQSDAYLAQRGVSKGDGSVVPWISHANVLVPEGSVWNNCHATGYYQIFPGGSQKTTVIGGFYRNVTYVVDLTNNGDVSVSDAIFTSVSALLGGTALGNISVTGCFINGAKIIVGNTQTGKSVTISGNIANSLYTLTPRTVGASNWTVDHNVVNDWDALDSETNRATLGSWNEHHNLFAKGNRFLTSDGNYLSLAAYQASVWGPGTGDAVSATLGFVETPSVAGNFQLVEGSAAANLLGADNSNRPSRWPVWPNSLAECKAFIADPDGWEF